MFSFDQALTAMLDEIAAVEAESCDLQVRVCGISRGETPIWYCRPEWSTIIESEMAKGIVPWGLCGTGMENSLFEKVDPCAPVWFLRSPQRIA